MARQPVLILSPHCDDVPLSLGASLLSGTWGEHPHVVIVFSQSAYTRFATWNNSIPETSALRQSEERDAAARAGYTVDFLPFGEPYVRPGYQDIREVFDPARRLEDEAVWKEVRATLHALLAGFEGTVVAPLGLGEHVDHRIVRACFLEAAEQNPAILPVFYEDLPYAAQASSLHIRERVPRTVGERLLCPVALRRGTIAAKLNLLAVYPSQLTEGQLHNVRAHWECRGGAEVVWSGAAALEGWRPA